MREKFWELPLKDLTRPEWEALCDGCGKCCLNKLEYEDTGDLVFTAVSCRLLDGETCQCSSYPNRHDFVPECIVLTAKILPEVAYWLPASCAYRLRAEGKPLYAWHHLISKDRNTVHEAGASVQGWVINETALSEEEWEQYVIEDLS